VSSNENPGPGPNRRDFIKGFAAAALAAPLLPRPSFHAAAPSCIVIGAGLSGLMAAHTLRKQDWDVTVLDARARTGGRVYSFSFDNSPLISELGAEWIGRSHTRVIRLCEELKLPLQPHHFRTWLMLNGVVSKPDHWDFSPTGKEAFKKLEEEYKKSSIEQRKKLDRYDWWTQLAQVGFPEEDLLLRDLADSTDFGESIRDVSAYSAASEYFESDSHFNEMDYKVIGGNSRLADEVANRIGKERIQLNTKVVSIREASGKVHVTSSDGKSFVADACICTAPSRMLLRIEFDPPLHSEQLAAARELQYSRIVKNSVLFRSRFWKDEDFSMVSDVTSHFYFHSTQKQPGRQGILCSYAIGEKADVLAAQGPERRKRIITNDLTPFNPAAPALASKIMSYAWQRDPYTEGAYAIYRPGQLGVRDKLRKPHGKILFAGEHLAEWQGFMEGAVVTGEEAANMLLGKSRA
jgi:monoamine oxidase